MTKKVDREENVTMLEGESENKIIISHTKIEETLTFTTYFNNIYY